MGGDGFAGGLASGIQSGLSLQNQIESRRQQQEIIDIKLEAEKFERDQAEKQAKKQGELRMKFFEAISRSLQGGSGNTALASASPGQQTPSAQGSGPAGVVAFPGAAGGGNQTLSLGRFFQLQELASEAGLEKQFEQAIEQGFIQTPESIQERAKEVIDVGLRREKTRAEIDKLNAQEAKARRPPVPNRVQLALEAAGGDPEAALTFLSPKSNGINVEFGEDGRPTSISTGGSSTTLLNRTISDVEKISASALPIQTLEKLLLENPTAPTRQGQVRLLSANLKSQLAAFQADGPTGKEIEKRIRETEDVSNFEFLSEMVAFSVAAMNNEGGRISDADVNSARKALGLSGNLFSGATAESILPRLRTAIELTGQKRQAKLELIQALQGGQVQENVRPGSRRRQGARSRRSTQLNTVESIDAELARIDQELAGLGAQ